MRHTTIAFLLIAAWAAVPPPAAGQTSGNARKLCSKEARTDPALAPGEAEVGEVVNLNPKLQGRRLEGTSEWMDKCSKVFQGMRVRSFENAGARIAINPGSSGKKGYVILGPKTEVDFTKFVVEQARGNDLVEMDLGMKLGQIRVALFSGSDELREGEYWIVVPKSGDREKTRIRMAGTDVYVAADERSTTVAVFEGSVTVESGGRKVALVAGTWTRIAAGDPPTPPVQINAIPGNGPDRGSPEDGVIDPLFDLDDPRLSLPR